MRGNFSTDGVYEQHTRLTTLGTTANLPLKTHQPPKTSENYALVNVPPRPRVRPRLNVQPRPDLRGPQVRKLKDVSRQGLGAEDKYTQGTKGFVEEGFISRDQWEALEDTLRGGRRSRITVDIRHLSRPGISPQVPYEKDKYTSGKTDYVIEGSVNGIRMEASPDTGADQCMISPQYASNLGKEPVPGTEKMITLANQKKVWSPGMIEVFWKFANNPKSHSLKCWILPGSPKDLVLGSQFLRATKTLTTFLHRVKKILLPSKLRLRLLGEEKQRMVGIFNGRRTTALADTGSDLMLVSSDYVRRRGLVMSTERKHLNEVELADGTRTWTCGVVEDATWTIGDETVRCDFHVLEGLPANIILSKDYLFDLSVFSNHAESFFDIDSVEGISLLCGVRLIEEGLYELEELESGFLRDITSQNAFNLEAVKKERVRRSMTRKKIAALPLSERPEALRREEGKNRRWDTARVNHKRLWTRPP